MHKMFLLCALVCATGFSMHELRIAGEVEADIANGRLFQRTQNAMDTLMDLAVGELNLHGYYNEADSLSMEYYGTYRQDFEVFAQARDIGDHKPLFQWLADKYNMLVALLGIDVCKKTHLSDLETFNYSPPVVFRPCTFPMDSVTGARIDEFRNHFSKGEVYFGLVPVVTYWATYAVVTAGTSGTGFVLLAGLAGDLSERLISFVTPRLSDKIYSMACGSK